MMDVLRMEAIQTPEMLRDFLAAHGLAPRFQEEFRLWLMDHGVAQAMLFPPLRERKHLEHCHVQSHAIAEEWFAIQDYFRETEEATSAYRQATKRIGQKYLLILNRIRKESARWRNARP